MRTYEETHKWITFRLDLRRASHRLWMLLGEAQSKSVHIAGVPLLPRVAREMHKVFLAKGALATTAIEGNTLTEEDVLKRLEGKLELPPSKQYLGQEIDNIIEACNTIAERILGDDPTDVCVQNVKDYNALVLRNLTLADEVVPGQIREHSVVVGTYRCAPPEDCEYLLGRLCDWLNTEFKAPEGQEIAYGILRAIIAHIYLAWIHPFGDGNGRTARLIEFQILLSSGVPDTAAHLLSNHYNQTRTEYYRQLDRAHGSGGDILEFIEYALQGFVDGLSEQIELIRAQQMAVHWVNYVHDRFRNQDRPPAQRRRRLVLDLSQQQQPVPISELRLISPRIAEAYASRTAKTIQRDVNLLERMGLVEKTPEGVRARTEIMWAFLPRTRLEDQAD